MALGGEVQIYMRAVSFDVVVPEKYVWEFMKEFGLAFAMKDTYEGTTNVRTVDDYYNHPAGWHVSVSVHESEEQKFVDFLLSFCVERDLPFRKNQN
jgi:hypothetical protein